MCCTILQQQAVRRELAMIPPANVPGRIHDKYTLLITPDHRLITTLCAYEQQQVEFVNTRIHLWRISLVCCATAAAVVVGC